MTVTSIEPASKTRYKVYVDGQFAFTLYKSELSRYHIAVDAILEEETYGVLRKESVKRAKLKAMHLLTDMGRTEVQLRTKLSQNGYPEDIVDEAMEYVKSFGYINDREYARNFVEYRKDKKSRKEIYALLCGKGLDAELIEEALDECYHKEDSRCAIETLLRKKGYDPKTAGREKRQKMMAYLVRKGFSYEEVHNIV